MNPPGSPFQSSKYAPGRGKYHVNHCHLFESAVTGLGKQKAFQVSDSYGLRVKMRNDMLERLDKQLQMFSPKPWQFISPQQFVVSVLGCGTDQ